MQSQQGKSLIGRVMFLRVQNKIESIEEILREKVLEKVVYMVMKMILQNGKERLTWQVLFHKRKKVLAQNSMRYLILRERTESCMVIQNIPQHLKKVMED